MKYTLVGLKKCPITQDVQSSIECQFDSYTEARMHQLTLESAFSDMSFSINFNSGFISLDAMLTIVDTNSRHIPKNFN